MAHSGLLDKCRPEGKCVAAQRLEAAGQAVHKVATLGYQVRDYDIGWDGDRQDDHRVDKQHARPTAKWTAAQAVYRGLDGGGQQDRQQQEEHYLLHAPQQELTATTRRQALFVEQLQRILGTPLCQRDLGKPAQSC